MSPLLSPTTVPKHPIRHLHERAQQDGKLLKFVCSVSNPRADNVSPMEEAEQKRRDGELAAGITPEQAAKDAEQVSSLLQQDIEDSFLLHLHTVTCYRFGSQPVSVV